MFENASRDERRAENGRGPVDPTTRARRRKRTRIVALIVVGVIVAAIATYVPLALNAPIGAAAATTHRPDVSPAAPGPLVLPPEGQSAISGAGADAYLGAGASGILASS